MNPNATLLLVAGTTVAAARLIVKENWKFSLLAGAAAALIYYGYSKHKEV